MRARLAVALFAVSLAVSGYYAFRDLTIEAFPDPTDTQVQVITLYPGQPAEEVERRVSIPLERALNGVPVDGPAGDADRRGLSLHARRRSHRSDDVAHAPRCSARRS